MMYRTVSLDQTKQNKTSFFQEGQALRRSVQLISIAASCTALRPRSDATGRGLKASRTTVSLYEDDMSLLPHCMVRSLMYSHVFSNVVKCCQ